MSKQSRAGKSGTAKAKKRRNGAGPIAFFVSLFIVALGTIQLVATFHTYALNLAELNGLKREEASLIAKKQELENDIKRWNDKAYITAQARERLGFVFPGEQAVRVLHPEAVTGTETGSESSDSSSSSDKNVLPWYSELSYAFKKADEPVSDTKSGASDGSSSSDSSSSDTSSKSNKSKSDSSGQSADSGTGGTDQSGQ
ncbi:septum formation initiator family protein [Bifidobacterium sp. SO4]|uniref:FtsB family cell division protein n=1 Tax=Bifidobacterium sp. SO4 TaxID=2809030 RepID=UPI001BDC3DC0|nr:septum formation initiator family protein [Bifidobacterium sp. SO4]MBT1171196.1 septum formation initiator family protein [Bifidobacterium sp. SO4]